jgi:hypothetical protein
MQKMKWNPERQCITNEDGSLIESQWYITDRSMGTISCSLVHMPDSTYRKWLLEGLKDSDKPIVDNSDLWAFDSSGKESVAPTSGFFWPECQKYSCTKRSTHDFIRNGTDRHTYLCDKHIHLLKAGRFTEIEHEAKITYLHGQQP